MRTLLAAFTLIACASVVQAQTIVTGTFSGPLPQSVGGTGVDTSAVTDGQILVGATSGHALALANITGTPNRVTVTNGANTISLSGPQDLGTTSTPQFDVIGFGTAADVKETIKGTNSTTTTSGTVNDLDLAPTFVDGGTTSSGTVRAAYFNPTINMTAASRTGFYEGLVLEVKETQLGSGANVMLALRGGSAGTTNKFVIDNSGTVTTGIWHGTTLTPTYGGSGVSNPTAHTIPINEGSSNYANVTALTNGQLIVGSTGADPVAATLGTGTGISITTGAGTLTVNNTGVTSATTSGSNILINGAAGAFTGDITIGFASNPTISALNLGVSTQTGDFTIDATATFWNANKATAITATLPSASGLNTTGRCYTIKQIGAGTLTLATTSSQLIDSATTYVFTAKNQAVNVFSNGTQWWIY